MRLSQPLAGAGSQSNANQASILFRGTRPVGTGCEGPLPRAATVETDAGLGFTGRGKAPPVGGRPRGSAPGSLIARSSDGVLRAARNLTLATLIEAVRVQKKQAGLDLVNKALLQPHWRSLDELL